MKKMYIAAIVPEKAEDGGGYSVYFPDVPSAITCANTVEESIFMAADVLSMMLQDMAACKKDIPAPSSLEVVRERMKAIRAEDGLEYPEDTIYQFFTPPSLDMVPVKITVSFPKAILEEADKKAKEYGFTRSGFLAQAVKDFHPVPLD